MDHWADPWADDADTDVQDTKPPPKVAPPTAPPQHLRNESVVLAGFFDDAGWGSAEKEEDWSGSGGWAAAAKETPVVEAKVASGATSVDAGNGGWEAHSEKGDILPESEQDRWRASAASGSKIAAVELENGGWDAQSDIPEAPQETKKVEGEASAASDSGTTVQDDDEQTDRNTTYPEDDRSTLSSTSPSNASHTELPAESPRTSIEEERLAGKIVEVTEPSVHEDEDSTGNAASDSTITEEEKDEELNASEDDEDDVEFPEDFERPHEEPVDAKPPSISALAVDSLLAELFPPSKSSTEADPPEDDPIHSTSTRKAWYRLTRKQTMREYNSGGDDNNYVRVTWANSQVRLQVGKIVSRWAAEDRMAGRGPAGRASFYWDTAPKFMDKYSKGHARSASTPFMSAPPQTKEQEAQPTANQPAAFNWNSSSAAHDDPWRVESRSNRPVLSPVAEITLETVTDPATPVQQSRPAFVHLATGDLFKPDHIRTVSLISPPRNTEAAPPISIDSALNSSAAANPPNSLSPLDTKPNIEGLDTPANDEDDEDEWGEMVQSPVASTTPMELFPEQSSMPAIIPPPTPWAKSSPFHAPASRDASPIVRLQGTVSPTSAVSKVDKYVPSVEQGPIGPHVLRKKSSSQLDTRERSRSRSASGLRMVETSEDRIEELRRIMDQSGKQYSPEVETKIARPPSPESSILAQSTHSPTDTVEPGSSSINPAPVSSSTADPWQDADFSIFESALPPQQPQQSASPSRQRSQSSASFTRSPPKQTPAPPAIPLTGATHSSQSRKAAEDELIREIVSGLPDLHYMLRS